MKRVLTLLFCVLNFQLGFTQELFSFTEPASNMPSKSIGFSFQNKYVGKQYLDNTSANEKMIKAFMVNDLIINYIKPLKNKTALNIDIKIANLLNRKYVANGYTYSYLVGGEKTTAVYYYPQATRAILLGLSLKF